MLSNGTLAGKILLIKEQEFLEKGSTCHYHSFEAGMLYENNMYAIVKKEGGTFYTSTVYGYFCKVTAKDDYQRYLESIHNQFYVVLNEEKNALVKKFIFPSNSKYLDPQILIIKSNQKDWIFEDDRHGCVDFLCGADFYIEPIEIDPILLKKCIDMDSAEVYEEYVEVTTEDDIENLEWVSGGFHDAFIKKHEQNDDVIYVLFGGVWGCQIEMWFEGDAACSIKEIDPTMDDPTWYCSTFMKQNGFFYLVDEADMTVDSIDDTYCWLRGRHVKYHVIPIPLQGY